MSRPGGPNHRPHTWSHTKLAHTCTCGVVVYGNGGASSHFMMHKRREDGHREIHPKDVVSKETAVSGPGESS